MRTLESYVQEVGQKNQLGLETLLLLNDFMNLKLLDMNREGNENKIMRTLAYYRQVMALKSFELGTLEEAFNKGFSMVKIKNEDLNKFLATALAKKIQVTLEEASVEGNDIQDLLIVDSGAVFSVQLHFYCRVMALASDMLGFSHAVALKMSSATVDWTQYKKDELVYHLSTKMNSLYAEDPTLLVSQINAVERLYGR